MPTASDLVTDLPADFEVFGQAVDTSLADLKGGTTGQVLKKNSNTDMDFVWSADSAGMTNPMTTTGDTIYSSSGSTPARLGIGTTGQVLSVSGGVPAWTTPATPVSKVVQIVTAFTSTTVSSTSVTWTTTNLTASITPTSASNKILVMVEQNGCMKASANTNGGLRLMRGATVLKQFDDKFGDNSTTTQTPPVGIGFMWLDSPATTSSTTYSTEFHNAGGGTVYVGLSGSDGASSIVLMEVTP